MKSHYAVILAALVVISGAPASAQITNLTVNGSSTSFTMTTGDTIQWQYNINPAGATVNGELWYDVNQNGSIDTATDKPRFIFTQTDGDTNGNGPPDMDGLVNGHVYFAQRVGLAAGKYVFKLSYNGDVHIVTGTCLPLSSSAHTISGTVYPPPSKNPRYVFVQARANNKGGGRNDKFWEAVTDSNGNYTIGMNADTSGNPWDVRPSDNYNPFPPAVVTPSDISIIVSAPSYSGNNFTFQQATAQVAGYLIDENNNPLTNTGLSLNRNDGGVYRRGNPNFHGFFQIGLLLNELTAQTWMLESDCNCNNGITGNVLTAMKQLPTINSGDSLYRLLKVYSANSQISGQMQVNGAPPGFQIQVEAQVTDTAQAQTWSDSVTGNFTVNVSNKLYSYSIIAVNLGPHYQNPNVTAHPGQTGVIVNLITTGVSEREPGIPGQYALHQNYPNPFNPSTRINYDLPSASYVKLGIFNVLGQEVLRLQNGEQHPGKYSVTFDAVNLPSGLYFYRLEAGRFTSIKKMILMK